MTAAGFTSPSSGAAAHRPRLRPHSCLHPHPCLRLHPCLRPHPRLCPHPRRLPLVCTPLAIACGVTVVAVWDVTPVAVSREAPSPPSPGPTLVAFAWGVTLAAGHTPVALAYEVMKKTSPTHHYRAGPALRAALAPRHAALHTAGPTHVHAPAPTFLALVTSSAPLSPV
ncbi:hypothetical protein BC826DRAFT_1109862 [Russula brevipes]|nr:hypothetical protein BC826DRAFT_1109862 [Russula brevipes]